jgi:hypothetical protein
MKYVAVVAGDAIGTSNFGITILNFDDGSLFLNVIYSALDY